MSQNRRFPPPWRVVELAESYRVEDANRFPLAYVYFCENAERRASIINRLSTDEARRIAVNMARLPELLRAKTSEPGVE